MQNGSLPRSLVKCMVKAKLSPMTSPLSLLWFAVKVASNFISIMLFPCSAEPCYICQLLSSSAMSLLLKAGIGEC